jgi:hypothetical protein
MSQSSSEYEDLEQTLVDGESSDTSQIMRQMISAIRSLQSEVKRLQTDRVVTTGMFIRYKSSLNYLGFIVERKRTTPQFSNY